MSSLIINFEPVEPEAINGYLVKYRRVGDSAYTTVVPNQKTSPITVAGINATFAYEGTIQADCSNGILSTPVAFTVEPCIGDNKKSVNGVCESGSRFNVSSTHLGPGRFSCIYRYMFSDGSMGPELIETSHIDCMTGAE